MSTRIINKRNSNGKRRRKKVKSTIPLLRSAIQHYLKMYSTTEAHLCTLLDISSQRYLQRFASGSWDYQATYALCYVVSSIVGDIITPTILCGLEKAKLEDGNSDGDMAISHSVDNDNNNNERQNEGAESV